MPNFDSVYSRRLSPDIRLFMFLLVFVDVGIFLPKSIHHVSKIISLGTRGILHFFVLSFSLRDWV